MSDVGSLGALHPHESDDTEEDPEAHATAREFVDYTEYLPSDLRRSLELINSLRQQHDNYMSQVLTLTKQFRILQAELPTSNGFARTVTDKEMELRMNIARAMKAAIRAREESEAEATKMEKNVDCHHSRAVAIRTKLEEVIIPSRDPTPVSPRKPRIREKADDQHCRITLRLNKDHTPAPAGRSGGGGRRRNGPTPRARQPPQTSAGNEEDWEDIPDIVVKPKKKKITTGAPKRGPKPPTDPPFSGGAQARDAEGNPIPSHLLPWNRLTNEELARLRKRMKKNAGWTPSVTMIIRELESLGRGPKHKEQFADQTEGRLGEDFLKIYGPEDGGIGDPEKIAPDDGEGVRENKGMRLNRAKKRKREEERKEKEREAERERQEAEAEAENARKAEEERKEKERLAKEARERERAAKEAAEREAAAAAAEKERLAREAREEKLREEKLREKAAIKEKERAAAIMAASSRKMRSTSISTGTTASTATTAASVEVSSTEDVDEDMPDVDADAPPPRRLGRPPKNPPPFKPGHKRAASTTTPAGADPKRSKRDIAAPAPTAAPTTTRKKGLVGRGTRKKPPTPGGEGGAEEEWVDEEEEDLNRYCLCDEVSRGTMVACENSQCPKVWFHIECVNLKQEDLTPKLKWFCPICSENTGKRGAGKRRSSKKA